MEQDDGSRTDFAAEQAGYKRALRPRQMQMIAIGGAIGTGLFMGAGGRLASAGPSLFIVYVVCGAFAFLILRALGELVLHRPASGSLVSYAREFLGEKAAFVSGWLYFLNWAMTAIADVTAIALYVQFWKAFTSVPQWVLALLALVVVLALNMVSVKLFGEMEFWFALIKVAALVGFLVVGTVFLAAAWPTTVDGSEVTTGLTLWQDNGGIFPAGLVASVLVVQGVVFAYSGIELIGTAAGEATNPSAVIPRAVNTVIARVAIFYVGSVVLLSLLLPYSAYTKGQSPFVTFFSSIGSPQAGEIAGSVMNFVVLTAALSSLNAGLYSTGRILRSLSMSGAAPRFTGRMNRHGVPYGGILLTASFTLIGVLLNLLVPSEAFDIVLNMAAIGIVAGWGTIILCQRRLVQWARDGKLTRPAFRMPYSQVTSVLTLCYLAGVLLLIAFDYPTGTWTVAVFVVIGIPALIGGWFLCRGRVLEIARTRTNHAGAPRATESGANPSKTDRDEEDRALER